MTKKTKASPGRPLRDPDAGKRRMGSFKLSPKTLTVIKALALKTGMSQSEIIDLAVAQFSAERQSG